MASDTQEEPELHMSMEDIPETPIVLDTPIDYSLPSLVVEGLELSPIGRPTGMRHGGSTQSFMEEQMAEVPQDDSSNPASEEPEDVHDPHEEDPVRALEQGVRSVTFRVDGDQWTRDDHVGGYRGARPRTSSFGQGFLGALSTAVSTVATSVSRVGSSVYSTVRTAVSEATAFLDMEEEPLPMRSQSRKPRVRPITRPRPRTMRTTGHQRPQYLDLRAASYNSGFDEQDTPDDEQTRHYRLGEWLLKTPLAVPRTPTGYLGTYGAAPTSRLVWSGPDQVRPPTHSSSRIQGEDYMGSRSDRLSRQEAWYRGASSSDYGYDAQRPRGNSSPDRYQNNPYPRQPYPTYDQNYASQSREPPIRMTGYFPETAQELMPQSTYRPEYYRASRHLPSPASSLSQQHSYQGFHHGPHSPFEPVDRPPRLPEFNPLNLDPGIHRPTAVSAHVLNPSIDLACQNPHSGLGGYPALPTPGMGMPKTAPGSVSAVSREHSPGRFSSVSSQEATRRKPKKPATYDGKTSWKDFHVQFEMIAALNGWDEVTKALELATSLRGNAQSILTDLDPDRRSEYASLVSALSARFEPDDQADVYLAQIGTRTRKKSESLPALGQEMKRLARHALPSAPNNVREWLALTYFVESLDNEFMEYSVKQAKPKSVDEAVKAATEVVAFQLSRRRRMGKKDVIRMQRLDPSNSAFFDFTDQFTTATVSNTEAPARSKPKKTAWDRAQTAKKPVVTSPTTSMFNAISKVVQQSIESEPWKQNSASKTTGKTGRNNAKMDHKAPSPKTVLSQLKCYGCGTKGHLRRDCTATCEKCHQTGHTVSYCRVKQCTYCDKLYHDEDQCFRKIRDSQHAQSEELGNAQ